MTGQCSSSPSPGIHDIIVAGMRVTGSGYPNAEQTLRLLQGHGIANIHDLGEQLPDDLHLWALPRSGMLRLLSVLTRLGVANLRSLIRVLRRTCGAASLVYVPYPAIPFLCLVRLLPPFWRPLCIVDAYISLWDSAFNDRASGTRSELLSRSLKALEGWALRGATRVLVDTEANRTFYVEHFRLDPTAVVSLPLAIDAAPFLPARKSSASDGTTRVLFVGTLIPLHGIEVILEAARQLHDRNDITFTLLGDGQLGERVVAFLDSDESTNLKWVREWCPLDQVAAHIHAADVCLGVFGGEGKASRVLPFKVYCGLAAGKAIVSQATMSLPSGVPAPPMVMVIGAPGAQRARNLAHAILELADDPHMRHTFEQEAAAYFDAYLSADALMPRWRTLLDELDASVR